jgi:hypothetical protein
MRIQQKRDREDADRRTSFCGEAGVVDDAQDIMIRQAGLKKKECWNCGKEMPIYYHYCPRCKSDV